MKRILFSLFLVSLILACVLTGCGVSTPSYTPSRTESGTSGAALQPQTESAVEAVTAADAEQNKTDIPDGFTVTTDIEDGYSYESSVLTITSAGEYTLSGTLTGQVLIAAGEDDKVTLNLGGVSIQCSTGAPIVCTSADKLVIHAAEGTYNEISDSRAAQTADEEESETPNAAIYAECDLTLSGTGSLVVNGGYNNGVGTKDDLKVKDLVLKVTAVNNALKGSDSVTVSSGDLILISTAGDGIKTSNSDISSKGNQRGTVTIEGGVLNIYAKYDGIDAAYDAIVSGDARLSICTGTYVNSSVLSSEDSGITLLSAVTDSSAQTYNFGGRPGGGMRPGEGTSSQKPADSTKGIKADNSIQITGGTVVISSVDDAIHANDDVTLENGEAGSGDVLISGGSLTLTTKDDGIHADGNLTINDGYINVLTSYEGLEGSVITISGGSSYIYATNDGINGSTGTSTGGFGAPGGFGPGGGGMTLSDPAYLYINGGYVQVTTPSGDTDAVDINGYYVQTGGFMLVLGGSSSGNMAGSIDVDGSISITGGTTVALGGICETPADGSCYAAVFSRKSFSAGDYTLTDKSGNVISSFTISATYSGGWICSDALVKGASYTLTRGSTSVAAWTQSSQTQAVS